jgi:hypothetical protein
MLTTPFAVKGKLHLLKIFFYNFPVFLFLLECYIKTITSDPHATKSIAPPIPFTNLSGIIQLAISQVRLTCKEPNIVKSKCPPRIIPKEYEEENTDPPSKIVTVSSI